MGYHAVSKVYGFDEFADFDLVFKFFGRSQRDDHFVIADRD